MAMSWTSLLVLLLATAAAARDAVDDSCDAIRDFVDPGFCAARLRSVVPGAATTSTSDVRHAHLLAAADLAAASGASAAETARQLAAAADDQERNADATDALEACGLLYGGGSVPALRLLRGYAAARSWGPARALLPLTGQAGIGCEAALGGGPDAARMAAANREFDQLTTMATALLNAVAS